jgi:Fe-S cluster assembly scaffold protein SufB
MTLSQQVNSPIPSKIFALDSQKSGQLSDAQRRSVYETLMQSEWINEKGKTEHWLNNQLFRKLQTRNLSLTPSPHLHLQHITPDQISSTKPLMDLTASDDKSLAFLKNQVDHRLWLIYEKEQTLVYFASETQSLEVAVRSNENSPKLNHEIDQLTSSDVLNALSLLLLNETLIIQSKAQSKPEILEIYHYFDHSSSDIQAQRIELNVFANHHLQVNEYLLSKNANGFQPFQQNEKALSILKMKIDLSENATCEHQLIQSIDTKQIHLHRLEMELGENASYVGHQAQLGALLCRIEIQPKLQANNARVNLSGLCIAKEAQEIDQWLDIHHLSANTHSAQTYKSILANQARAIFTGKVLVGRGAKQCTGDQNHASLMLSTQAKTYTRPQLEIYHNDVQCAHGATIAQIDDDALFYLCSRGLSVEIAKQFLTTAFAMEIAQKFNQHQMQGLIQKQLCEALGVDHLFSIAEDLFDEVSD